MEKKLSGTKSVIAYIWVSQSGIYDVVLLIQVVKDRFVLMKIPVLVVQNLVIKTGGRRARWS